MRSPSSLRRRLLTTAATAAALLLAPAAAHADQVSSVSIANGDAVVDRPIVFEVQGAVDHDAYLSVDINPAGIACASTRALNANNRIADREASVSAGPLNGVRLSSITLDQPGSYSACLYVTTSYPTTTTASAVLPLTVRNPNVALSMALLAGAVPSASVPLAVTTYAEVARELYVDLNAEGVPCGLSVSINNGTEKISGMDLLGGPTTAVQNISMPSTAGRYHLCGYVGRSHADATPLAVVDSGSFLVGVPPAPPVLGPAPVPSCTIGPRAVKARGTLRIRCRNASGAIEIRARRGGRTVRVTRRLVGGVVEVRVRTLGMTRGVTKISVFQGRTKLAGRSVRRR